MHYNSEPQIKDRIRGNLLTSLNCISPYISGSILLQMYNYMETDFNEEANSHA